MALYEVVADADSGAQYVYRVTADGPLGAVREAYRVHGEAVRAGEQSEYLTPWHTVEEV